MAKTNTQVICKNIFKSSDNKTVKATFTQRLLELINQLEKKKVVQRKYDNLQVYLPDVKLCQLGGLVFIESE